MASSRRLPTSYNTSTYGGAPDVYTKLLLHMEGVNTESLFNDSAGGHVISAVGNVSTDTTRYKFGSTSAHFDGTGDYLTVPATSDWNFGTDDFTIDFWINWVDYNDISSSNFIFSWNDGNNTVRILDTGALSVRFGGTTNNGTDNFMNSNNTWYHVAIVRSSGTVSAYVNGNLVSGISNTPGDIDMSGNTLYIGSSGGTDEINAYIDEFRISVGIARWTSAFSGSLPSSAYSSRDYTSLATWEAATDNDLVTATVGEILECYDDAASFDDYIQLAGATTDSSYFRVVKPATGEGHDGTPNNGVMFSITANYFNIAESYTQIQDIIMKSTTASTTTAYNNGGTLNGYIGCIAWSNNSFGFGCLSSGTSLLINCLAYECTYRGFHAQSTNTYIYNCTAVDCGIGFVQAAGTAVAKNCISCDNTTDFTGTWTKTTCYEGDATVFANQAGDDYHLAAGDTTCRGEGTDLSSDGTYAFDDDIDGETRSAWDIGFDEYSASGWAGKVLGITGIAKINGIAVADIANVCGV